MAQPDSLFVARLMAQRPEITRPVGAADTPSTHRPIAGGPVAAALIAAVVEAGADRLFDVAGSEVTDPAAENALLLFAARLHGTLRARADGTLGALLAEYRSLRLKIDETAAIDTAAPDPSVERPGSAPEHPHPHAAIDRAMAASADAFDLERRRQREIVRQAHDHAMRGALNAIRLASLVRRQTGADTNEIVERHSLRMGALLAHGLGADTADRALRPEELPARDLAHAARDAVSRWRNARPGRQATCTAESPTMGHYDLGRVLEALIALLDAVERHAGSTASLRLVLGREPGRVTLDVEATPLRDPPTRSPTPPAEWPLIELLLRQTAAAHRGAVESIAGLDGRIGYRMTLVAEPPDEPSASMPPPAGPDRND